MALLDLLGIDVPIIQAPIGSACTPSLAAAVCNAGGLGMLALTWKSPAEAAEAIRETRRLTQRPFGANVVLAFAVDDLLETILDSGVRIVSTFWGDPATVHGRIGDAGALHLHTAGSVAEGRQAVEAGVDVVVAQGWEAGGHVRGTVGTMALVPAVVDAVSPAPVIAAGGIADGRGVAAALALGAQGAMLGTRFLTAREAASHDAYRHRIIAAGTDDSLVTECFDGGWPHAPHRALHNATVTAWRTAGQPASPYRPGENDVVARDRHGVYRRYEDRVPLRGMTGSLDEMALYAGQSAGLVHDTASAGDIVARIADQARRTPAGLGLRP